MVVSNGIHQKKKYFFFVHTIIILLGSLEFKPKVAIKAGFRFRFPEAILTGELFLGELGQEVYNKHIFFFVAFF